MSLIIERARVSRVMIGNEWIECIAPSFVIDAYEYCFRDKENLRDSDMVCLNEYGFGFNRKDSGRAVYGPMSSIQAVEYDNGYDKDEA